MPQLEDMLTRIRACTECADHLSHQPRPIVRASRQARICIVGQAPGTRVHKSGIPFDDPSGDRLRDWMGVSRDLFYDQRQIAIIPMGFCFPGLNDKGADLPPRKECAKLWRGDLMCLLPQIELTLVVGLYAQAWHLGKTRKSSLTETVANWHAYLPSHVPLPHPSWRNNHWLKKNLWFGNEVVPFLQAEVARLTEAA